ncbi:Asp-tRNA(Asn)/Glu-tRNA(Gln) amidotransferase GatCAB subunit A [Deinococcus irradiatisoli]|uniref:Glutamyl-tRNA(Gln) amidotransferase subunit A n=1 Tax=Deinococcus irradiatisoli TaxID=2202254 RepID=A0A2Z3JIH1_9DEIO|nr:Asp-tRNA(Asn)/Glu-tRNA(Gln) amidotransferase subunit GatA [Deinococcus irradiatisoli]AWN23796.1 Asp-tRNA(Asn)/Glu-tRNA(Gln) amidotransferase GatCAB subunit A [Deinococcus irradiatisoli]
MPLMFSASQLAAAVQGGQDPQQAAAAARQRAEADSHNALISVLSAEMVDAQAQEVARRLGAREHLPLAGVPTVIKDNLNLTGTATTCGSRMLANYVSPYTATAVARLQRAGAIVVGKANMDEFAMGSSTETSASGPTTNPWDPSRVPGGTSGGSAAAVAGGLVPLSLGSDTGGSVRQPAGFTGVYGFKPTYGRVSRYGLVAHASSLDQIGPLATSTRDLALILDAISGHDPLDATSLEAAPAFVAALGQEIRGLRVGVIREALAGNTPGVEAALERTLDALRQLGASVGEISLPTLQHAVAAYYLISTPEASSNLARYDGMVYGTRAEASDVNASMGRARAEGFGPEVKRRILIGTYALSSGYYDAYYSKAMKVRRLIADDFNRAFGQFDILVTPTSPFPAFRRGEKVSDPVAMYAADVDTVGVSLAGLPALSVPAGFETVDGRALPVGVQLIAPALNDERLITVADALERSGAVKVELAPS